MQIRGTCFLLALAGALAAGSAPAQTAPRDTATTSGHLFTRRDLYFAGGFAVATVALAPLDRLLAWELQDSSVQANHLLADAATGVRVMGSPGGLALSGTVYVVGRLSGDREVSAMGLHTAESIILAEFVTNGIKHVAGRARPSENPGDASDFTFLGGFEDDEHRSFPSGHSTAAFAFAAAASTELGERWPRHRVAVGTVLFSGATLVGLSRMYNNRHWASDVAMGAAIGSFTGWKVVRYTRRHPENPVDRLFLGSRQAAPRVTIAPDPGGLAVMLAFQTR
jgi:membrane-associated phospholipid phosphatase